MRIKAEAEADANQKIAASLTPELIQKLKYEKWDGALSKYANSSAGFLIQGE